jgi:hypothetical protein
VTCGCSWRLGLSQVSAALCRVRSVVVVVSWFLSFYLIVVVHVLPTL